MNADIKKAWDESTWAQVRKTLEDCFADVDAGKIKPKAALVVIMSEKTDDEQNSRVCLAGMLSTDPKDKKGTLAMKGVVMRGSDILGMMVEQIQVNETLEAAGPEEP